MVMGQQARVTTQTVRGYKQTGRRFAALTAYDFLTATAFDRAGIPIILVGDTLGIFMQGHDMTLPVTVEAMSYHCEIVVRAVRQALVVGDLPFCSYHMVDAGIQNAAKLVKQAGVHAVKVEGCQSELIKRLTQIGIPVMGHLGLTPQSYHQLGGNKVQARTQAAAEKLRQDAIALEQAGIFALVLEAVPNIAAREVTAALSIPTIGIGAGPDCDGQVLVAADMLGLHDGPTPRFVKQYAHLQTEIMTAAERFMEEVSQGIYPDATHSYDWSLK
ncbi:MAG: 3-methyl-2-oxobutanoate hydroxymethyltransferase [Cyanobacteria bacterium P01_C01_bin.120]